MRTILRRLQKQKFVTSFKIISLGIGISCAVILFYIAFNLYSTDRFYPDKELVYQVFEKYTTPNDNSTSRIIRHPVAGAMMTDFSQVEYGTTVRKDWDSPYEYKQEILNLETYYADSLLFKVFQRKCILGDAEHALKSLNTAVITKSVAHKLFGKENPINQILKLRGSRLIEVKAVIEDWPSNASFDAEVILSFETLKNEDRLTMSWHGGDSFTGYVKLLPETDVSKLRSKFNAFVGKYTDLKKLNASGYNLEYFIVPLIKARFLNNNNLITQILILVLLGTLLLALVCFNAYLLSVSQQNRMKKELVVRRINGSSYSQVLMLIFKDALFQFSLALGIAILVTWNIAPIASTFFNFSILKIITSVSFVSIFLSVTAIIFLAIFILPSIRTMRGMHKTKTANKPIFADFPLALQIGISFTLLTFFWFVFQQLNYIQSFDKGYSSEGITYVELHNKQLYDNHAFLKREISKIPGVISVGTSDDVPLYGLSGNIFGTEPSGDNYRIFRHLQADNDFFETLNMTVEGKGFSNTSNNKNEVIITEAVADELGFENPLYKTIYQTRGRQFTIVGVAKDIVSGTIHSKIDGIVFQKFYEPDTYTLLSIKMDEKNMLATSEYVTRTFEKLMPNTNIQLKYYNQDIEAAYKTDFALKKAVTFFAIIATLLTIAGLVGFAISSIQKRMKELGVRKVNGATEWNLLTLLNKNLVLKAGITLVLFIPISWYLVNSWIQFYAYHVPITPIVFAVALMLVLFVVFVTVSITVWNAVRKNPIESLRYE